MTTSYQALGALAPAPSLPADARSFRFPPILGTIMLVCALAAGGFVVFVLMLPLTDPMHYSLALMIVATAMGGSVAAVALQMFFHSRDTLAVNSDGIWYLHPKGDSTFIAWPEVAVVSARDVVQRLLITDANRSRTIRAEYQLENFDELRAFIMSHAPAACAGASGATVFQRNWVNRGFFLGTSIFFLLVGCAVIRHGRAEPALIFVGVAALGRLGFSREISAVEIAKDGFVIKYPGRRRMVPFDAIDDVVLVDVNDRGNVHPAVMIERPQGRPIRLFGFREGSVALYEAMNAAWRSARGIRPSQSAASPVAEPVISSAPSPAVFHGNPRSAVVPAIFIAASAFAGIVSRQLGTSAPHHHGAPSALLCLPGIAAGIYLLLITPRRLTIEGDSFIVEYYGGRRVVPYASIRDIELRELRNSRGARIRVVNVVREGGALLKLAGFVEGAPHLYASLQAAWRRACAGGPLGPADNSR